MSQIVVNSLIYAGEIAIIAIGISLCYAILRFANFCHVQFAVIGGYLAHVATTTLGIPLVLATALSMALTGALAVAVDRSVFRRLRGASPEALMIVSWGVALVLRAAVGAVFGGSARSFDIPFVPLEFAGARFTTLDLAILAVTTLAMAGLHLALRRTRIGTALRALASNRELAETRGIPAEPMIALMWFVSGAFAALGGVLFACATRLQPNMDLVILLPVFAAVTIGGMIYPFGAVLGAVILSFAQNLLIGIDLGELVGAGSWYLPGQFRDYVAVLALVIVLLARSSPLAGQGARG